MKACVLLCLLLFLVALPVRPQTGRPSTSAIETIAGGEPSSIPGREFNLPGVSDMSADLDGNVYFSVQSQSRVYRLGRDGQVTVYAGSGVRDKEIDGAPAASSPLFNPYAVAADANGNLYVMCADSLVSVDVATRAISTLLQVPYGPPGAADSVHNLEEMVVGPNDTLYFVDGGDHRIKAFSLVSHAVNVIAGNGAVGPVQSGALATSSPLRYPNSLAVASDGTIYFGGLEPAIFSISPEDGRIRELSLRLPNENTPLNEYDNPQSIVLDRNGNLFVAQANRSRVLRIARNTGAISLYAGTGVQGFSGDGSPAEFAALTAPNKLAIGPSGVLFIGESSNIRTVESSSRLISTVVGHDPSTPLLARALDPNLKLSEPALAMAAADGSVFITSSYSDRLLHLQRDGSLTSAAGGGAFVTMGSRPGMADQVALYHPQGLWLDANGDVYFSDYDNRIIRRLDVGTGAVSDFATTSKHVNSAGLLLYYAGALVADNTSFFLSDPNADCVWRISRNDGSAELYAGIPPDSMVPEQEHNNGIKLAGPAGLALDSAGNLYIADGYLDTQHGRILRVESGSREVTTILDNLRQPSGLVFRSPGVLCFSEAAAHQVRCINLSNRSMEVLAGTGQAGLSGDGGAAQCAQLNRPMGISFDANGNLYIADTGNQRIRLVRPGNQPATCRPPFIPQRH